MKSKVVVSEVNSKVMKERAAEFIGKLQNEFEKKLNSSRYTINDYSQIRNVRDLYIKALENFIYNSVNVCQEFADCQNAAQLRNTVYWRFLSEIIDATTQMPQDARMKHVMVGIRMLPANISNMYSDPMFHRMDERDRYNMFIEFFSMVLEIIDRFPSLEADY